MQVLTYKFQECKVINLIKGLNGLRILRSFNPQKLTQEMKPKLRGVLDEIDKRDYKTLRNN